jgi:hypothetical protein
MLKMKSKHAESRFYFSLIQNAEDNRPVCDDFGWLTIVKILSRSIEREDKNGRAFIPAMFGLRTYQNKKTGEEFEAMLRRVVAVEHVSMAVADYDDGTSIQTAHRLWADYEHVIYSSHSHTAKHNKFRVVLPLEEPILAVNWRSAWLHFYDMSSGEGYRIDRSCKDPSRLYYLPSHPPGAKPVFIHNLGALLSLPTTKHHSEKPKPQQDFLKNRLRKPEGMPSLGEWLDDKGVRYDLGSHDLYGTVYKLHECPWGRFHTDEKDGVGHAAVFERDGKWAFSCCHDHCSSRGWRDFREQVAPKPAYKPKLKLSFGRRR